MAAAAVATDFVGQLCKFTWLRTAYRFRRFRALVHFTYFAKFDVIGGVVSKGQIALTWQIYLIIAF